MKKTVKKCGDELQDPAGGQGEPILTEKVMEQARGSFAWSRGA